MCWKNKKKTREAIQRKTLLHSQRRRHVLVLIHVIVTTDSGCRGLTCHIRMTHLIFTISNHWVQCCDFCCIKDWERNSLLTNTSVQLWSQIQTSRTDLISESNYQKQTQLVEQWGLEEEVTEDEGRFIILFTYFRIKILTNLHSDVQQHWKFQVKKKKKKKKKNSFRAKYFKT